MKLTSEERTLLRLFFRANADWLTENAQNREQIKIRFTQFAAIRREARLPVYKMFMKSLDGKVPRIPKATASGGAPRLSKEQFFEDKLRSLMEPIFVTDDPILSFWEKQAREP